jgi:hypothetical protein
MKPYERKVEKAKKKDAKKRLQTGEWSVPEKEKMEPVPKIPWFDWSEEA